VLSYELLVGFTPMVGSPHGSGDLKVPGQPPSATLRTLHFPSSLSEASRDFILASLSENPGDRPIAKELLRHAWLCA
jgi:aurora kinase